MYIIMSLKCIFVIQKLLLCSTAAVTAASSHSYLKSSSV